MRQAKAVSLEGHPTAAYNGLYTHDSTYEGWPVLRNASGSYCYHYAPLDKWFLNNTFTPAEPNCMASIVAKEGPLPVGDHAWDVYCGGWAEGTLTVVLLVRPLPSSACAVLLCILSPLSKPLSNIRWMRAQTEADMERIDEEAAARALAEVQKVRLSPAPAAAAC